jgi:pimeloyl-ACP methyl ester carboxylesterase
MPVWAESAGPPDAPAIVVVHGSMDRSAGLLRLGRRLSDRFHVIRYDRRGYGRSIDVRGPYRVRDHVDDVVAVVDERTDGRGAALAFGHSFGGHVVLGLAERRADLVDRVAVYESPLSWLPWWPDHTAGGAAMAAGDPADAAEAFMRRLVGDDKWERLPPSTRSARRREGAAMIAELSDLRALPPWDAAGIEQPVLSLVGEFAQAHHLRAMQALPDLLRHCRTETIAGAAHFGPNTHADAVAAALVSFVEESEGESFGG